MEHMEFLRFNSEVVGMAGRIDVLDKESVDASPEVRSAYALVRVELLAKLKICVDSFKSKLDALVLSKSA